ncbi:uncharacterized protein METZ01_LOCUS360237, partial [marine metagenome]
MKQHTIKEEVSATGIGVHSGKEVKITLKPAPADTGIIFWRNDDSPYQRAYKLLYREVPAVVDNVTNTLMAT